MVLLYYQFGTSPKEGKGQENIDRPSGSPGAFPSRLRRALQLLFKRFVSFLELREVLLHVRPMFRSKFRSFLPPHARKEYEL